jgi:hypothetical protein
MRTAGMMQIENKSHNAGYLQKRWTGDRASAHGAFGKESAADEAAGGIS